MSNHNQLYSANHSCQTLIPFHFREAEREGNTFFQRVHHELKIVNPMNLLMRDEDIVKDLEVMKYWRKKAEAAKDGVINITPEQKA